MRKVFRDSFIPILCVCGASVADVKRTLGMSNSRGSGFGLGLVSFPAPHVGHVLCFRLRKVVARDLGAVALDLDHFPVGRFGVAPLAPSRHPDFKSLRVLSGFVAHRLFPSSTIYKTARARERLSPERALQTAPINYE